MFNPSNISDMAEEFQTYQVFNHLFGSVFNFNNTELFVKKGSSAKGYLNLSLEEIYNGGKFEVEYSYKNIKGMKQMDTQIPSEIQGVVNMMGGGTGFQAVFMVPDEEIVNEKITINLEPGYDTYNPLVINLPERDLIIFISEKEHPVFKEIKTI